MSLELIMNANGTIGHGSSSPISNGEFIITSTPDAKAKAQGEGIFVTPLGYTFSGGSSPGFVDGTIAGGGVINATAKKVKAGGALVIRLGDSGTMSASGTLSGGGTGSVSGPVEVIDSGQTKVKAV
jgi:hypothetical protein